MERIDKLLSSHGHGSRKDIDKLARNGNILVNGKAVKNASVKVNPDSDVITIDGNPFIYKKNVYYLMNKPADVVCATEDKDTTVIDILPDDFKRPGLFPVGRLDKDTEGMLIITDDGDFSHRILSPKKHVEKEYEARLSGKLIDNAVDKFRDGIVLKDFTCLPAELNIIENSDNPLVRITVSEGKFHQVKRMCLACGAEVVYLKRIRMGKLLLDENLKIGEARELTAEELKLIEEN